MTIRITIKQEGDADNFVNVTEVNLDLDGNKNTQQVHQLKPGEAKDFYIHSTGELRVYETGDKLIK